MADGEIDRLHLDIKVNDDNSAAKINAVADAINNLQKSLSGLTQVQDQLKTLENTFKALNKNINKPSVATDIAKPPKATIPDTPTGTYSTFNKVQREGAENAKKNTREINKQAKALKNLKDQQKKTNDETKKGTNAFSKFGKSLGRIAMYRAVRSILKEISQSLREGLENFLQFDSASNKSMSNVMNSVNQLKNTMGVTFGYLVQTFEPILTRLSDMAVQLFDSVNMALASMAGKDKYAAAIKGNEDYAKSLKKVNGQLLAFDEFTTLGGGTQETKPEDMFQEVEMPTELSETAQTFKTIFEIVSQLKDIISELFVAIKPVLSYTFQILSKYILPAIKKVVDWIVIGINWLDEIGALKPILMGIATVLASIAAIQLIVALTNPFTLIVLSIGAVIGAMGVMVKYWDNIVEWFKTTCSKIGNFFVDLWHNIANGFATMINFLVNGFVRMVNNWIDGINSILGPIDKIAGLFGGKAQIPHWDYKMNWKPYADGGQFNTGDYFVANENGNTELIASTNKGGSVMNLDEWASISYSSFYRALSDYNAAKDNGGEGLNLNQLGRAVASNNGFINEMNRRNAGMKFI